MLWIVIALFLLSLGAMAALLPTTELSINDSCEVTGPIQKLKSITQGERYWVKQLELLDKKIRYLEEYPEIIRSTQKMADKEFKNILEKSEKDMEETYSKYPELRPSPQQTIADELRKHADDIEHAQLLQTIEQIYAKDIKLLKLCRPKILAATQNEIDPYPPHLPGETPKQYLKRIGH